MRRDAAFVIIRNSANHVVFTERRDEVRSAKTGNLLYRAGAFDLPGGGFDPEQDDDEPILTAVREAYEELNLRLPLDELLPLGVFQGRNGDVYYFEYYLQEATVLNISDENANYQWLDSQMLNTLDGHGIVSLHRDVALYRLNVVENRELNGWHSVDNDFWVVSDDSRGLPKFEYHQEPLPQPVK